MNSFKIKAQAELKNWKVKGAYREIGADFHTAGYIIWKMIKEDLCFLLPMRRKKY